MCRSGGGRCCLSLATTVEGARKLRMYLPARLHRSGRADIAWPHGTVAWCFVWWRVS